MFYAGLGFDAYEPIAFKVGMFIDMMIRCLDTVWLTFTTESHKITRKLKLVRSFCCKVAQRNPNVHKGWLCKGDNYKVCFSFSFSSRWNRSARKGPYTLRPCLSAVSPRLPSKQCQYLSGWTQIVLDLGGLNVGRFCSPLFFPSFDRFKLQRSPVSMANMDCLSSCSCFSVLFSLDIIFYVWHLFHWFWLAVHQNVGVAIGFSTTIFTFFHLLWFLLPGNWFRGRFTCAAV